MALLTYASPMEEAVIEKAIKESLSWEQLPKRVKLFVGTQENYVVAIRHYCMNARLRWDESPAANFCKESEYYDEMIKFLRRQQSPFPYHLSDYICRVMRMTPFKYYSDLLLDIMKQEKSYDTIPNFTAADALRETGIGRNQFIEIMNKTRSKLMWRLNKGIVKDLLPTVPVEFTLEPWWLVRVVNLSTDEYRKLTEEEMSAIEKGGRQIECTVGEFNDAMVRGLYTKGLVYFDVPVYPKDRFRVVSLEGFVSNRNETHQDPGEKLLYSLFVTSSEQATVEEMAETLQADLSQLGAAISLACRLGWAEKVLDMESVFGQMDIGQRSLSKSESAEEAAARNPFTFTDLASALRNEAARSPIRASTLADRDSSPSQARALDRLRLALMVDANLTSFLMMGSFSYELKQQAVTLFEAGKLGERAVSELCGELRVVERTRLEGELQKFTEHAFSLRCALSCLRTASLDTVGDSASTLNTGGAKHVPSPLGPGPGGRGATGSQGQAAPLDGSEGAGSAFALPQAALDAEALPSPHGAETSSSSRQHGAQPSGEIPLRSPTSEVAGPSEAAPGREWGKGGGDERAGPQDTQAAGGKKGAPLAPASFNRVDMLRCESLAGLPPATLQRLLERDYNVIVSIIPLPSPLPMASATGEGPVHFGPPAPSFLSPWTKLLMYSICCAGPLTVVLVRGQRLRKLPPPLKGCSGALLWTWDGTSVGGVGGQMAGSLVPSRVLLHVLNNLLRHSALMAQPLSFHGASWDPDMEEAAIKCVPLPIPMSRIKALAGRDAHSPRAAQESEERRALNGPSAPAASLSQVGSQARPVATAAAPVVNGALAGSAARPPRPGLSGAGAERPSLSSTSDRSSTGACTSTSTGLEQLTGVPATGAATGERPPASSSGEELRQSPAEDHATSCTALEREGGAAGEGDADVGGRGGGRGSASEASEGAERDASGAAGSTTSEGLGKTGAVEVGDDTSEPVSIGSRSASMARSPWNTLETAAEEAVHTLGLHAVGFLRMMRVDANRLHERGPASTLPPGRGPKGRAAPQPLEAMWVPHSVEFGIPMFDAQLCKQVCECIVSENMLSKGELEAQQMAAQELRSTLRDFIADYREHGAVERGVRLRNAPLVREASRKWSGSEDRPTYEVVTPHDVVLPSESMEKGVRCNGPSRPPSRTSSLKDMDLVSPQAPHAQSTPPSWPSRQPSLPRKRRSAFLSRRLSTAETEFWFHSDSLTPYSSSGGGFPGGTADPLLQFGASDEELLNTVVLPGLNLLFDGRLLLPLDISQYLQGHSAPSGLR